MFHEVRNLSKREELHIIHELVNIPIDNSTELLSVLTFHSLLETQYGSVGASFDKIINLAHLMRSAKDPLLKNLSATLSTRQLLRIAHRMAVYSPENVNFLNQKTSSKSHSSKFWSSL